MNHDGWTFAVDFPRQYHSKMAWSHCVRRRKWIRFRRYSALNSWCAIGPLHKDPTEEPFIGKLQRFQYNISIIFNVYYIFEDIAVGGTSVPSAESGLMVVWAVTSHGRVMFRAGVSTTSPEGQKWNAIPTPSGCEVCQVSVGNTGMVWAACQNGRALVRSGVTRDSLTGKAWLEVKPPGNSLKIIQVSVGHSSVWCITNDNHVWFRRGVHGSTAGICEDAAIGSGWVEMIGNISSISVAQNDQVFAVGSEDRSLYFRSGVTTADPTGKKWKLIQCQMQMSRNSSNMSLYSRRSSTGSPNRHRSLNSLKYQQQESTVSIQEDDEEQSRSAPVNNRQKPELWQKPTVDDPTPNDSTENVASSCPINNEVFEISGKYLKNPRAWSPVRSVGSVVGIEAHPETDSAVFEAEGSSRDSGVFGEDDFVGSQYIECDIIWTGVAAGAVTVDPNQLPNWFNDAVDDTHAELSKPWRLQILNDLKERNSKSQDGFEDYAKAVETSSWVKSGEVRIAIVNGTFEDCLIELEWVSATSGMDSGTFTVLNADGVSTKMQFSLSEITCVMTCSEPGHPRLAIHAPRLPVGLTPLKLQFSGDSDLEDWLSHLTSVTSQLNEVSGRPSNNSIWTTSQLGEVFVFDPMNLCEQQKKENLFTQEFDVSATETPYLARLHNGMPVGSILKITGCVYDDADLIRFDLQAHATVRMRHKSESFRNMPLHLNPRFSERCTVLNSMEMSNWETELRDSRTVFTPGKEFELLIKSEAAGFRIFVDDKEFILWKHRGQKPETVTSLHCSGRVKLFKICYETTQVILPLNDLFWRQMGGHLRKVETCSAGVTWGIGYDHQLWVYTGGWGGFLKGLENSTVGINNMSDISHYYIYENQRWNPISGFSTASLPTDRHLWSDVTGKHKRSKEFSKLLSMHWQFVSDWVVDFNVPGGCDGEGWQYAVDFPMTYHPKKQFTDYARRRRWYRKCRLNTRGPWQEVGQTRIVDISLQSIKGTNDIIAWAVSSAGDVLLRRNVTTSTPAGNQWDHVPCDVPIVSISCSSDTRVWAVAKTGAILFRIGITPEKLIGETWQRVEAPSNVNFKSISAGALGVWALDKSGRLGVRREVSAAHPEGTSWQLIQNVVNDAPHFEGDGNVGFKCVSVGEIVMALSNSGYICKRDGITSDNPTGTGWTLGILGNWQHVTVNSFN